MLLNEKPDFLIIHLITSLPIILNFLFKFETKIILRISGYPRLNFLRKYLWKIFGKKLHKIVCPTEATRQYLIDEKIFDPKKVFTVKDPIISISLINDLKKRKLKKIFLRIKKLFYPLED